MVQCRYLVARFFGVYIGDDSIVYCGVSSIVFRRFKAKTKDGIIIVKTGSNSTSGVYTPVCPVDCSRSVLVLVSDKYKLTRVYGMLCDESGIELFTKTLSRLVGRSTLYMAGLYGEGGILVGGRYEWSQFSRVFEVVSPYPDLLDKLAHVVAGTRNGYLPLLPCPPLLGVVYDRFVRTLVVGESADGTVLVGCGDVAPYNSLNCIGVLEGDTVGVALYTGDISVYCKLTGGKLCSDEQLHYDAYSALVSPLAQFALPKVLNRVFTGRYVGYKAVYDIDNRWGIHIYGRYNSPIPLRASRITVLGEVTGVNSLSRRKSFTLHVKSSTPANRLLAVLSHSIAQSISSTPTIDCRCVEYDNAVKCGDIMYSLEVNDKYNVEHRIVIRDSTIIIEHPHYKRAEIIPLTLFEQQDCKHIIRRYVLKTKLEYLDRTSSRQ